MNINILLLIPGLVGLKKVEHLSLKIHNYSWHKGCKHILINNLLIVLGFLEYSCDLFKILQKTFVLKLEIISICLSSCFLDNPGKALSSPAVSAWAKWWRTQVLQASPSSFFCSLVPLRASSPVFCIPLGSNWSLVSGKELCVISHLHIVCLCLSQRRILFLQDH